MKRSFFIMAFACLCALYVKAQINFNDVVVQGWIGSGQHETMFVLDYDSDSTGTDSTFAWGIRYDADSISGDSILSMIAEQFTNFTYDYSGGFLNNINYNYNSTVYTNPNPGWFSVLESSDGLNWNWNNGISDNTGDQKWFGIVVMNSINYDAYINVPLITTINQISADKIQVFPNPCSDYLYIENIPDFTALIIDSGGHTVYYKKNPGNRLNISLLEAGSYTLILKTDLRNFVKKLVIN